MAAPTLVGQGTTAAVTTGNLTITLPSHQAGDLLILTTVTWIPNTVANGDSAPALSGWHRRVIRDHGGNPLLYTCGIYARWATSSGMSNPTITRGSNWDSGADTCWAGRAYAVRGVEFGGGDANWIHDDFISHSNFYDDMRITASPNHTAANGSFEPVTVNGSERSVIQFYYSMDNNTIGAAPGGWTAGTASTSGTGTDAGFQTYRQEDVSASTSAAAPTIAAPAQGFYFYVGLSFRPRRLHRGQLWKNRIRGNFNNSSYY